MKFMVIVKASKKSEAGVLPSTDMLAEMGKFNDEMVKAGIMLAGEGLHPSSKGARLTWNGRDAKPKIVDGPFAETKELVAGFWLIQVKSLEEAKAWMARCPAPMGEDEESTIEIRQVFDMADFGDNMTPELKAQQERQEKTIRAQHS